MDPKIKAPIPTQADIRAEWKTVKDGEGKRIEEGIITAVALLNKLGFSTTGSCEGHVEDGHGLPYAWVEISTRAEFNQWFNSNSATNVVHKFAKQEANSAEQGIDDKSGRNKIWDDTYSMSKRAHPRYAEFLAEQAQRITEFPILRERTAKLVADFCQFANYPVQDILISEFGNKVRINFTNNKAQPDRTESKRLSDEMVKKFETFLETRPN